MEEEKARLRAIDARPVKKIAEAKARKKLKLHKRLDQAKQKANVSHNPCICNLKLCSSLKNNSRSWLGRARVPCSYPTVVYSVATGYNCDGPCV